MLSFLGGVMVGLALLLGLEGFVLLLIALTVAFAGLIVFVEVGMRIQEWNERRRGQR